LTDFGISFYVNNTVNIPENNILGTPEYMSPEQASGKKIPDFSSDLYSLGVVLFECLTANVPFKGNTPAATINQIINTPPPSPLSYQIKITSSFEQLVMKLLSKDSKDRYQSAKELFDDLNIMGSVKNKTRFFNQFISFIKKKIKYIILPYQLKQIKNNSSENIYTLRAKQSNNNQISCIVGRATPSGVQPDVDIQEPTISRQHIEIVIINHQLGVRHLYSENRTSINKNLLEAGIIYQLAVGDRLLLGKAEFELIEK